MANRAKERSIAVVLIVGLFAIGPTMDYFLADPSSAGDWGQMQRFLLDERMDESPIYPWARHHLRPLTSTPGRSREVVFFWHIPKSGGTTVKTIYECMGKTLASKAGADPKYGHHDEDEIVAFNPWPGVSRASYVNVDSANKVGIDRGKELGLVPSGLVDVVISSDPAYAVRELFDERHKGRAVALFRHPIERLVSKFYYLQNFLFLFTLTKCLLLVNRTWERQYRPRWQQMSVEEWAEKKNTDRNHLVKRLAGLGANETATEMDLRAAMRTIKKRFVVGLLDRMEESVRRFNAVMGINDRETEVKNCMDHFFHHSVVIKRTLQNPHATVLPGSPAWKALAKTNALDVRLYEFILDLFDEQEEIIEKYRRSSSTESSVEASVSTA
ncbi:hypothetical protein ACHAWF_002840 [Thalassiosira exigua]